MTGIASIVFLNALSGNKLNINIIKKNCATFDFIANTVRWTTKFCGNFVDRKVFIL